MRTQEEEAARRMTAPDSRDSVERVVAEMRERADTSDDCCYGTIGTRCVREWADRLQALADAAPTAGGGDALVRLCDLAQDVDLLATPENPRASKIASAIIECIGVLRGNPLPDAAVGAQGDEVVIGATRCYGDDNWFRELTARGVTFLVPLDQQDKARHALAAPAAGKGVDDVRARYIADMEDSFRTLHKMLGLDPAFPDTDALIAKVAALTRQPVAGDGMNGEIWLRKSAAEQMQADAAGAWRLVLDAAAMSPGWNATSGTNLERVLALLAPAATPTDGEGR